MNILKKDTKFAKSATGTNLYFCIYKSTNGVLKYSTPSFEELIEIQKQEADLRKNDKVNVAPIIFDKKNNSYSLAFYLQPNDFVYLPTDIEIENPDVNFIKPCNLCPHMKSITLSNILDCIQNKKNEILIDSNTLERARGSIEKMVAIGRQD